MKINIGRYTIVVDCDDIYLNYQVVDNGLGIFGTSLKFKNQQDKTMLLVLGTGACIEYLQNKLCTK